MLVFLSSRDEARCGRGAFASLVRVQSALSPSASEQLTNLYLTRTYSRSVAAVSRRYGGRIGRRP